MIRRNLPALILALALLGSENYCVSFSKVTAANTKSSTAKEDPLAAVEVDVSGKDNSLQTAFKTLEAFLSRHPNNAQARYLLGRCFARDGYSLLAEEQYKLADLNEPHFMLAKFREYIAKANYPDAYKLFSYVQKQYPGEAPVLLMEGMLLSRRQRISEAEKKYNAALNKDPRLPGVHALLADSRASFRLWKEALTLAEQELALNPSHYPACAIKAKALIALGRPGPEVIKLLKQTYAQDPLQPEVASLMSQYLASSGAYVAALEPAIVSFATAKSAVEATRAQIRLVSLLSLVPRDKAQLAINNVCSLISDKGIRSALYLALGRVFEILDRPQQALEQYKLSLLADPSYAGMTYFSLAKNFEKRYHNYDLALNYYLEAQRRLPYDQRVGLTVQRFSNRLSNRRQDLAWQLKDWFIHKKYPKVNKT